MNRLVSFFIDRSFVVNVICLAICGIGLMMFMNLKRNLAPKVQMHRIRIEVSILGASPQSMEKEVAFPIEDSLRGMPAIKEMKSYSMKGFTSFDLTIKRGKESLEEVSRHPHLSRRRSRH